MTIEKNIIMKSIAFCTVTILCLTACATTPSQTTEAVEASAVSLPYPQPDLQNQLDQLGLQVSKLEHQINRLQTRIQQLEQRNNPPRKPQRATPIPVSGSLKSQNALTSHLEEAQQAYQQGHYALVLNLLRGADSGGDGSQTARESMYLLLQAHQQKGNCQSVINIGQRYATQYAQHNQAADALYAVGQCQWHIQQRDIARDTWTKLIRQYPNSQAAQRAAGQLK